MTMDALFVAWAGVVGACVGSFLNVCIGRWPHDQSVVTPRSRCPRCERAIAWYDNIPIVSWLVLRAKCRGCGLPISVQYPLVELLVAVVWALAFREWGAGLTAVRVAMFITILIGIAITDAKHYLIPDGFTVSGLVFVLATALVAGLRGELTPFAGPWDAVIGACVGAGAVSIIGWLGEVALKKEAMGFGDVTLMAVVGGAVGPARALLVLFVGAALGAVVFSLVVFPLVRLRRGRQPVVVEGPAVEASDDMPHVPFGVFLAPAAVLTLLWGDPLITWYLNRLVP